MTLVQTLIYAKTCVEALQIPSTKQNLENAMRAIALIEGAVEALQKTEGKEDEKCTQS